MTSENFVKHYSGRSRKRYEQAVDSLDRFPLDVKTESGIKAFVKAEKFNPSAKVNPDPRMIQARSPRFNVELGKYLKPMEHHLYRLRSPKGLPLLGKGLSMQERGRVLKKIWDSYSNPCCVSLDGSRWDQHVSAGVLQVEHRVYLRMNNDRYLAELLAQQVNNRCVTARGWKYKTYGKRMSGDMNTALGNCLLMCIMVRAFLKEINIEGDIFDDGDDVLLIFDREHLQTILDSAPSIFLEFGQEIKVENISTTFENIEWCQGRPVLGLDGTYQMCANWRKVISQSAAGMRYWDEGRARFDMAYSVGQCLMSLYPGIPVLGRFADRLCRRGKLNRNIYDSDWIYKLGRDSDRQLGHLTYQVPSIETRSSFSRAWGIDEVDQLHLEQELEDWEVGEGTTQVPLEVAGDWDWSYHPGTDPTDRDWLPTNLTQ